MSEERKQPRVLLWILVALGLIAILLVIGVVVFVVGF
jgi:hypothetical protein